MNFPRQGWAAKVEVYNSTTNLGADASYTKWLAGGSVVHSFGENTVRFTARAGGKIGSNPLPAYDQLQWGGFLKQSGYATGQLVGANLQYGQLMDYRRIVRGGLFDGAYGGLSLEVGNYTHPLVPGNASGVLKSMAVFVAADSPLGPAYLGYGRSADGTQSLTSTSAGRFECLMPAAWPPSPGRVPLGSKARATRSSEGRRGAPVGAACSKQGFDLRVLGLPQLRQPALEGVAEGRVLGVVAGAEGSRDGQGPHAHDTRDVSPHRNCQKLGAPPDRRWSRRRGSGTCRPIAFSASASAPALGLSRWP